MTELAPMSAVLKSEYESEIQADVPAGQDVTVLYDSTFALSPEIESWSCDQEGLTVQSVQKFKDRIKVRFNQVLGAGKKLRLKIKPKRLI